MKTVGLVQAHHRGWNGAADLSLATLGGRPAVEHVIARLKAMPGLDDVIVAVPDDPGNSVFHDIAAKMGVKCLNGSRENVLARIATALDAVGADACVHVMGQHCFADTALLSDMLAFLRAQGAGFVSLPDAFTPYDPPAPEDLALPGVTQQELVTPAATEIVDLEDGGRLLTTVSPASPSGFTSFTVPLVRGGSAVWVRNPDPELWESHAVTERVTARLD